ncbi:hypothetical protein HDV64DRAFT_291642 [Trichoderma sp. TUCIM 5745]
MSISALVKQCTEIFCERLVKSDSEERAIVENHLFRFNIWAKSNGAISDSRDSLDCRLRKDVISHSLMQDLLTALLEALNSMASHNDENPQIISDDEGLESVGDILSHLFRFTRAIRRSGAMRNFVTATDYFEYDEITGENLTVKFQDTIMPYLNATLKDASPEMKERLSETIYLRYQSLLFLKSRFSRKVASKPVMEPGLKSAEPALPALSGLGKAYSVRSSETSQRLSQTGLILINETRRAPSVRTATTVNTNHLPRMNMIPEPTTDEYMAVNLPHCPRVPAGQTELECPYCFWVCPAKEFTKENWPQHINQDLAPFICVLESCPRPYVMYESHAAWISHMETDHARRGWSCMDQSHDSIQYFEEEQSFRRHIIEHHCSDVTEDELADHTKYCYGSLPSSPLFESCPFCNEYTDDASVGLDEHITLHLLYLSQVSIPGDFLESQCVELGSEQSGNSNCLEGSNLSHEISLRPLSSFRTPNSGTSDSSTTIWGTFGLQMSISRNGRLSSDIIEPPPLEYSTSEPDIWDTLQIRERLQCQKSERKPKYDAEMDSILWNFRLRYILGLGTENFGSDCVNELAIITSCLQLAGAFDTHGRYTEAEKILTKMLSDSDGTKSADSRYSTRVMIRNMLQSCPSDRYEKARQDVKTQSRVISFCARPDRSAHMPIPVLSTKSPSQQEHAIVADEDMAADKNTTETKNKGKAKADITNATQPNLYQPENDTWIKPRNIFENKYWPEYYSFNYKIESIRSKDRRGGMNIALSCIDAIHGYIKDGCEAASLLIYEFGFCTSNRAGRIKSIDIQLLYGGSSHDPEVLNITPSGSWTVGSSPTETTATDDIVPGVNFKKDDDPLHRNLMTARNTIHEGSVAGIAGIANRKYGPRNAVKWALLENKSTKLGVPSLFRTAVLLKRADSERFSCQFEIKATLDRGDIGLRTVYLNNFAVSPR